MLPKDLRKQGDKKNEFGTKCCTFPHPKRCFLPKEENAAVIRGLLLQTSWRQNRLIDKQMRASGWAVVIIRDKEKVD